MSGLPSADRQFRKSFNRDNVEGGRRLLYELRHKSSKEVTLAHKASKDAQAASAKKAAKAKYVWTAVDHVLRGDPQDWNGKLYETKDRQAAFLAGLKQSWGDLRAFLSYLVCKHIGHSWAKELSTKYHPARSAWERQLQASSHPYQYFFRCTRFECPAEKPRE